MAFSRSGRVIVEEYMEGPEFSVDALVCQGEITISGFADRHIFFPPYFIEMGHTIPSSITPAVMRPLIEAFNKGVKALGITNGAAKGDVKLTSRGPMIGEIAARLSGGYMSGWTFPYSSGVLPTRGAIEIAIGKKPGSLESKWNWTSAERAFISIPGEVLSVQGIETAKVMPFVRDVFTRIKSGSPVMFPENNVTKCGNIISVAPDRETAVKAAENAARSVLIRLKAPNKETAAFLAVQSSEKPAFPPDAFAASKGLLSLLTALPETVCASTDFPAEAADKEPMLLPFTEFTGSGLLDYVGRSIEESLGAVRAITGLDLPFAPKGSLSEGGATTVLGRSFWQALIRGGYQGATYYIDSTHKRIPHAELAEARRTIGD
jgi:hypothetical protein